MFKDNQMLKGFSIEMFTMVLQYYYVTVITLMSAKLRKSLGDSLLHCLMRKGESRCTLAEDTQLHPLPKYSRWWKIDQIYKARTDSACCDQSRLGSGQGSFTLALHLHQ